MIFEKAVPSGLVQNILHFLHSDYSSAHLRVTKALEEIRSRVIWLSYKRDVEAFVPSCFVCQKRSSPTKKHVHSLREWKLSFLFSTVGIYFLGTLPSSHGNHFILLIRDRFTKSNKATALQISQLQQQLRPSWIIRLPTLAAPRPFTPTKDGILKLSDATWTSYHEYVADTHLHFHRAYEQARQYLNGQQNVNMRSLLLMRMAPHTRKAKWYSSIIP